MATGIETKIHKRCSIVAPLSGHRRTYARLNQKSTCRVNSPKHGLYVDLDPHLDVLRQATTQCRNASGVATMSTRLIQQSFVRLSRRSFVAAVTSCAWALEKNISRGLY